MNRLHGPWTDRDLGTGERRRDKKAALLDAARLKQCACDLCEKGQRGLPDNVMWKRDSYDGTLGHSVIYLCAKPVIT